MMMAAGHSFSGWCAALMFINALSLFTDVPPFAMLLLALGTALAGAGSAIIADWDHPNSTITTAFGPLSQLVHEGVIELHYTVAALTNEGGTRKPPGAHRGVTHWWPTPLVIGGLVSVGCWWSKWFIFGVLIVLYTGAIRGITVPDYAVRQNDTVRHRWTMLTAHGIIDLIPFMNVLKRARKHVNRTHTIKITYWWKIIIPVGKIATILVAADFALIAIRYPYVTAHGVWIGVIVCLGMYLHILGDAPTEMGIPGRKLNRFWQLPKWLAFRAGGPFEILALWVPMVGLGIYLIPGVRPREEVLMVQGYIVYGVCVLTALAIVIEFITRAMRKRSWIR
jgi:membrane-bound metal-dependent hydrolase YbcI (DUF457 family)